MRLKTVLATAGFMMLASPVLALQGPPLPPGEGPGSFERADLNKDGAITMDEVRTTRTAVFDRADKNKDGFVTEEEMRAARPSRPDGMQGRPRPPREAREGHDLMSLADANKDGAVTRAEFDAAMAARAQEKQTMTQQRSAEMFTRLDANKDGRVTRDELDAMRGKMGERMKGRRDGPQPPPPFGTYDANKDGKISRDEWIARPDPMFERADANKDGRLTREEAAAAARQGREGGPRRGPGRPW